jgi:hypothetical protein
VKPQEFLFDRIGKGHFFVFLGPGCEQRLVVTRDTGATSMIPLVTARSDVAAVAAQSLPASFVTVCNDPSNIPAGMNAFSPVGDFDDATVAHCNPEITWSTESRPSTKCRVADQVSDTKWLVVLGKTLKPILFVRGDALLIHENAAVFAQNILKKSPGGPACTITCPPGQVRREITVGGKKYCYCAWP